MPKISARLEIRFSPHLEILCWVRFRMNRAAEIVNEIERCSFTAVGDLSFRQLGIIPSRDAGAGENATGL
ncbi:hypothetical protein [Bradyrhizobium genosp. P]|uniref:hypothetical protein n=1 Tax=Bradyrhizobium genosp. P TaxID=83641 RepID=UPI003CF70B46